MKRSPVPTLIVVKYTIASTFEGRSTLHRVSCSSLNPLEVVRSKHMFSAETFYKNKTSHSTAHGNELRWPEDERRQPRKYMGWCLRLYISLHHPRQVLIDFALLPRMISLIKWETLFNHSQTLQGFHKIPVRVCFSMFLPIICDVYMLIQASCFRKIWGPILHSSKGQMPINCHYHHLGYKSSTSHRNQFRHCRLPPKTPPLRAVDTPSSA